MDKYCRDLICYPLEASCTLSAWKRERETDRQNWSLLNMVYESQQGNITIDLRNIAEISYTAVTGYHWQVLKCKVGIDFRFVVKLKCTEVTKKCHITKSARYDRKKNSLGKNRALKLVLHEWLKKILHLIWKKLAVYVKCGFHMIATIAIEKCWAILTTS